MNESFKKNVKIFNSIFFTPTIFNLEQNLLLHFVYKLIKNKTMNKFALVLICAALSLTSCKKDCEAPALAENILGSWTVSWETNSVEFKSNGTLIDPNDALIGGEINGTVLDEKTYSVIGSDSLYLRAENGAQFIETTLPISGNECDVITVSILGISGTLNRE